MKVLKTTSVAALFLAGLGYVALAGCGKCGEGEAKPAACVGQACVTQKDAGPAGEAKPAVIETGALRALLQTKTPLKLLDARTGKFDDGKRIPGAESLAPDAAKEVVEALLPAKDALIVTYCAGLKCPASRKLAEHLRGLGYENVLEYSVGIAGWTEAGNPVLSAAE
jgi:rhodanese-related sulfurtransferase